MTNFDKKLLLIYLEKMVFKSCLLTHEKRNLAEIVEKIQRSIK